MRTLSCTVGLLLSVSIYCCIAMPQAVEQMSHGVCCFTFSTVTVPKNNIVSVTKTHRSCPEKAFVYVGHCFLSPEITTAVNNDYPKRLTISAFNHRSTNSEEQETKKSNFLK
uniref:Chemokine interleukin-8-like domain-containing protein n=1 Tax=Gasterosteus aculeatus aculeatus TaxID=481459 RepID=A0AAQ4QKR3_GASAC